MRTLVCALLLVSASLAHAANPAQNIFCDLDSQLFVTSATDARQPSLTFTQNNSVVVNLYLLRVDPASGSSRTYTYDTLSGASGLTVSVALGNTAATNGAPVTLALQETWTPIANGFTATFSTSTSEIATFLAGKAARNAVLQVQISDGVGAIVSHFQAPVQLRANAASTGTPLSISLDGNKGDVTVSSTGQVFTVNSGAVAFGELSGQLAWARDGMESLIGLNVPGTEQAMFTARDDAAATYVRNGSNMAVAAGLNLTPISVWNSGTDARETATLISPRHVVLAHHYWVNGGQGDGRTFRWVTAGNVVVTRTLTSSTRIASSDLRIGLLDSAVPDTIAFAKVLASHAEPWQTGRGLLFTNQNQRLSISEMVTAATGLFGMREPTSGDRMPFYTAATTGDSSHPVFMVLDGELILVGSLGTTVSGASIAYHHAAVNAAMTSLGGGYQLTDYTPSLLTPVPWVPRPNVATGYAALDSDALISPDVIPQSIPRLGSDNEWDGNNTWTGAAEFSGGAVFTGFPVTISHLDLEEMALTSVAQFSLLAADASGNVSPVALVASQTVRLNAAGTAMEAFRAQPYATPATANPDTSGATLLQLETEVNELKALLRSSGLLTP